MSSMRVAHQDSFYTTTSEATVRAEDILIRRCCFPNINTVWGSKSRPYLKLSRVLFHRTESKMIRFVISKLQGETTRDDDKMSLNTSFRPCFNLFPFYPFSILSRRCYRHFSVDSQRKHECALKEVRLLSGCVFVSESTLATASNSISCSPAQCSLEPYLRCLEIASLPGVYSYVPAHAADLFSSS